MSKFRLGWLRVLMRRGDGTLFSPAVPPVVLNIATALTILALHNRTFFARATDILPTRVSLITLGLAAFALTLALTALVSGFYFIRLQKAVLALLLILCAAASYFTDRFGVLFDPQMIENLFMARPDEAQDLLSAPLLLHLGLYGLLPALIVLRIRVRQPRLVAAALIWCGTILLSLALCVALILSHYSIFASFRTPQRDKVLLALEPYAVLSASYTTARLALQPAHPIPDPIALDARKLPLAGEKPAPRVIVMVVGESARAANQSLGGYARETNPELARRDVIYFPDTTSCGTATGVSVPCIFSILPAKDFSISKNRRFENVLDLAKRLGFDVQWIENNREHYEVAARLPVLNYAEHGRSDHCPTQRCPDDIILPDLDRLIAAAKTDTLIVVHLVGSHMNYYDRYPKEFEHFTPVCHGTDLSVCPRQALINGYDNSVRYTDHVLARMIDSLSQRRDLNTALVYTSDHGESLGEHGLFAHSTPMLVAPPEQTKVPLLLWLSQPYVAGAGIDLPCLRAKTARPASHDNIFHTLLGLSGIETTARDPALDLTDGCPPSPP